jgi:hypothetical protein
MSVTSTTSATKSGEGKERVVGMEVSTPSMLRVSRSGSCLSSEIGSDIGTEDCCGPMILQRFVTVRLILLRSERSTCQ